MYLLKDRITTANKKVSSISPLFKTGNKSTPCYTVSKALESTKRSTSNFICKILYSSVILEFKDKSSYSNPHLLNIDSSIRYLVVAKINKENNDKNTYFFCYQFIYKYINVDYLYKILFCIFY